MKQAMSRINRILMIVLACILLFAIPGICANPLTDIEFPSSPNPVGSGARALGMGGAFIAIADDATAASWNPGGLLQLEKPEISVVGGYAARTEDISFGDHPEADGSQPVDYTNLNYLSAAYPFQAADRNMIVSLNYQRLFDFHRDWTFKLPLISPQPLDWDYKQEGDLYALGLAYCAEITSTLTAGLTINYWGDFINNNEWEQKYNITGSVALGPYNKVEKFDFSGWNANLGFLWRINGHWTLGGVFKTPFTADIDHSITENGNPTDTYNEKLRMPMAYGLGLAYRFSDNFSIAGDLYRTHWNDFEYKDHDGNKTSPITGKPGSESNLDPTTWARLGAEYLFIGKKIVVPLRCGVFYDPAPAEGSPDDYYGMSLGSGIAYKQFVFDIAYQYRFGNNVGKSMLPDLKFSQDVAEHTVYSSLIIHF